MLSTTLQPVVGGHVPEQTFHGIVVMPLGILGTVCPLCVVGSPWPSLFTSFFFFSLPLSFFPPDLISTEKCPKTWHNQRTQELSVSIMVCHKHRESRVSDSNVLVSVLITFFGLAFWIYAFFYWKEVHSVWCLHQDFATGRGIDYSQINLLSYASSLFPFSVSLSHWLVIV